MTDFNKNLFIEEVRDILDDAFMKPKDIEYWLRRPRYKLDYRTPLKVIHDANDVAAAEIVKDLARKEVYRAQ